MAQNRHRNRVQNASGETIAETNPPPSVIEIIKDNKVADGIWKTWLYSVYTFAGALSEVTSDFTAPNLTTAERDALTAVNGMIIYNTTTNVFNFYENGAWVTK